MPEGHTLHRLARSHQRTYAGQPLAVTSPQGRFASGASLVDGQVLAKAEAHGKHLFHNYVNGHTVHIHLGLYGKFTDGTPPAPAPVGQIRMRLVSSTQWTDLRGPTACEVLTPDEVAAIHARLGPDPLRRDADPDKAWTKIAKSRTSIAVLLMDQSVVAGIGNIYRAELLFRHGIHPLIPGRSLDHTVWKEMWPDLATLMRLGVRRGRIDTVRDEHLPEATGRAPRQDRHGGEVYVYRRTGQPCLVCGTPVMGEVLAARNNYWCPTCQPA
ncbi:zinc finger domain-containing protein [Actinokineospora sp. NBRC 105648]|uniref:Fpg/Nei family DNA glycosylase n=1 Tax=Actinokineospora sp. NBRC 105648 TaxID=3032206 RepID=UPI0024A4BEE0|nr:zinc finger domain-containing protein [Actinokineospora sp. NBRC 105648]GLZ37754.1 endonuclease VIII [Actinokineospora sp. NBRC 105648]